MQSSPFRSVFPYFSAPSSVYLDSGATSLKLQSVIDVTQRYYQDYAANVHRSQHQLGASVTAKYEGVRQGVQEFIGAASPQQIVFTKGATEGLNLIAFGLQHSTLLAKRGQNIVIACSEHHANIVPWQRLAKALALVIKVVPMTAKGALDIDAGLAMITADTALVAVAHVSNALGNINSIEPLLAKAKRCHALTVVDGTQAVAHMPVDVGQLGCDFYVFSGHKMYGPTGIGVLYAELALLEQLPPYEVGGEMVASVSFSKGTAYQAPPLKFEAGTPNIAGVLGLGQAVTFLNNNFAEIIEHEQQLTAFMQQRLQDIPGVRLWGDPSHKICSLSLTVEGFSPYDLALGLDAKGYALRAGRHCAMPLMDALGIDEGTLRLSLGCYNSVDDIEGLAAALTSLIQQDSDVVPATGAEQASTQENTPLSPIALSIQQAKGWDETYRQIMLASKALKRLTAADKTEHNRVIGCETDVWLTCDVANGRLQLQGEAASKIIRGLLAVVFEALENRSLAEVTSFELSEYFGNLDIATQLSESRSNGLQAVVTKIKQRLERI